MTAHFGGALSKTGFEDQKSCGANSLKYYSVKNVFDIMTVF
jgi:hypothetical protein